MRQAVAVAAGAGAAVLGALILGEYEFSGVLPLVMGVLFGLAVAELMSWVGQAPPGKAGRRQSATPVYAVTAAALTAGGLLGAGWISVHHRHEAIPVGAWTAAALGAATAVVRSRTARRRVSGNRPAP